MEHRPLGKTGLQVTAIGVGCAQLGTLETDYAVRLVQRALELGVNYFDTARGYWDSEIKLGLALRGYPRERVIITTKTGGKTEEDAWRDINESLERLQVSYVDNCLLHSFHDLEDVEKRLGSGGAIKAFLRAKEEGLIRHIGFSTHRSDVAVAALQRFDFELLLIPMNIVEREPLAELIPLCQERGVGVTIMKPVATGLLPAKLALRWLLQQPVASIVPGTTTLEQLEENTSVESTPLSEEEERQVRELAREWAHRRCRICSLCLPCPQEINIPVVLGTDVMYDHYRTLGAEGFAAFPWSQKMMEDDLEGRQKTIAAIESCTRCGDCEKRCPYGLPIME
ncbi:MAG: aldo/keto reductase, partial [Anaerolineae bacterium]|nr:aldo/keto reductase [Anaerolineae bacterium]